MRLAEEAHQRKAAIDAMKEAAAEDEAKKKAKMEDFGGTGHPAWANELAEEALAFQALQAGQSQFHSKSCVHPFQVSGVWNL